jgi:hypothetical protein
MQISKRKIDKIIDKYNELYRTDIRRVSRSRELVVARQCFFFILRRQYRMSYQSIGNMFGMNHATIIHGEKLVCDMLSIGDRDVQHTLQTIVDLFRLYSVELTNFVSEKPRMMEELEKMLKSLRVLDEVTDKEIKQLVDIVWKSQPTEVA